MVGVITGWDVLSHPVVTVRCFGWRIFFRAVVPWQGRTFLSLLQPAAFSRPANSNVQTILERCVALELRAMRIYSVLAEAYDDQESVGPFFAALARQEQCHADLLEVARVAAIRRGWTTSMFSPVQDYLPRLEREMEAAEWAVREIDSIDAAFRLVIQIESSEINQVFNTALAATDTAFVKRLRPFKEAMESHISYIVKRIPPLSPNLTMLSRELRARFPQTRSEPR
jgi:hypothetical protein